MSRPTAVLAAAAAALLLAAAAAADAQVGPAPAPEPAPAAQAAPQPEQGAGGAVHRAAALPSEPAESVAPEDVVDVPVEFTVRNRNRTRSRCSADGESYTVRGHLTAPARVLEQRDPAVTLYLHGTNTGEWIWRLDVDGRNYVEEMAARGHASVTVDRLGYGDSDHPHGLDTCSGAHADIADQIVSRLRSGDYETGGAEPAEFSAVFLGGHSSGGLVAEAVAASFHSVDGLLMSGWAAVGITGETNRRFLAAYETCLDGGEPYARSGDPAGYVHFDSTEEDFLAGGLGEDAPAAVVQEVRRHYTRSPCGVLISEPAGILADLELVGDIEVPVRLVYGERDALRQGVEGYADLFTASSDVTEQTLPEAGHFVTVDANAPRFYDGAARWLRRHG
ncbi:alpha/beta hydrolase [Streptomonospora wellingtoniae]|uniref:Alpha/beta fold hydrolase n=1 Tax=Streptomonospora wellingtoniae TaxID=3075544 RepID=A0ABU2KT66_9ACTN|nr:alpha/beta fold hydrolase [Streptomonospora sp. DSM 45055]MDT0302396.1 alpha/beta fold hydrolase [Streptomonospora sp. DSM 45055]